MSTNTTKQKFFLIWCDGPRDITQCVMDHEISRGVWQMDCEITQQCKADHEITRGVRQTDHEIIWQCEADCEISRSVRRTDREITRV